MAVQISHVGLCVSDLEKSLLFYVDGLGFEVQETIPCGEEVGPLGGTVLKDTRCKIHGIKMLVVEDPDGTRVELMKRPPA
jgi:Glyoxalase/Bleomycin resistance protein/Dioxygenase superfamily